MKFYKTNGIIQRTTISHQLQLNKITEGLTLNFFQENLEKVAPGILPLTILVEASREAVLKYIIIPEKTTSNGLLKMWKIHQKQ